MGKREKIFANILQDKGLRLLYPTEIDKEVFYNSSLNKTIQKVYRKLGGVLEQYPTKFGDFDITTETCLIELDEENHFNRYRKITLEDDIYKGWQRFPIDEFKHFCDKYELKAGGGGNFWSTPNSEKQFGISSDSRDLSGNGSSRWKQRAFYDFLKDVYSGLQHKQVYRFSIYENVGNISLNQILEKQKASYYEAVYEMVIGRIINRK